MSLELVPLTVAEANAFVFEHHRHHAPMPGAKFCIGAEDAGRLCGVAMVGRPVARAYDDGFTLEVNRSCTDGTRNANSFLYAWSWKAARALGYRRLITYTQEGESGASLKAAGWKVIAERPPRRSWAGSSKARPRLERGAGEVQRTLWEAQA